MRTGFETTIRKRFDLPMPEQVSWETDSIEKVEAFEFDDPFDRRRYFEAGDNQIAGVGGFFGHCRQLVILGYYTSEIGCKQERVYVPVPGHYDGQYPYAQVGRVFSA